MVSSSIEFFFNTGSPRNQTRALKEVWSNRGVFVLTACEVWFCFTGVYYIQYPHIYKSAGHHWYQHTDQTSRSFRLKAAILLPANFKARTFKYYVFNVCCRLPLYSPHIASGGILQRCCPSVCASVLVSCYLSVHLSNHKWTTLPCQLEQRRICNHITPARDVSYKIRILLQMCQLI